MCHVTWIQHWWVMDSKYHLLPWLLTRAGNFHRPDAAAFLRGFSDALGPLDSMLIALDATDNAAKV